MNDGWIKLHRKIQDCEIWDSANEPFDRRSAWIDLLLLCNHHDKEIIFDGKPFTVSRGKYVTSVRKLALRWGWSTKKTLSYLRLLIELKMITKESDNKKTLLTIENYGFYQDCGNTEEYTEETQKNTQRKRKLPTNNNIKNDKNIKESISKDIPKKFDNPDLQKTFEDFVDFRKQIKAPMSNKAIDLAVNKLQQLAGNDDDKKIAIINQSILQGWKGLFDIREGAKSYGSKREPDIDTSPGAYSGLDFN